MGAPWIEAAHLLAALASQDHRPLQSPQAVRYEQDGRLHTGDLYPAAAGDTGLVVVPGAAEKGKDDPRLIRLAGVLVEAGFTVLVPDIPSQRALQVGPENIADITDAVDYLAESRRRVGVAAISYAVGPAVLAAIKEGRRLAFLVGVGGYYDLTSVLTFFTTGYYFEDGLWQKRTPNAYGKWVFVRSNVPRLWDSGDRTLLSVMASRRMADPDAPITDLATRLTSTGRSVYDLLSNGDPNRVPELIDALPPVIGDDIRALDLKNKDLSGLSAHLLLIHGRDDAIIPAGESRKLAATAPHATLFLVDDLAHADWKAGSLPGMIALLRALCALLDERA
ncbi:hypothetical protein [Telmatospirillum sp.]|uniref:alpha/beta hydrolase family protein n=1 Tax=Telmatospirillum sp. TaxID=2079197 RepID=UPI002842B2C3|nr:hypothetical protein [Telmatospirillum sp.]MDR3439816.1 hypothetical protein [Telmatospirillum sp.]